MRVLISSNNKLDKNFISLKLSFNARPEQREWVNESANLVRPYSPRVRLPTNERLLVPRPEQREWVNESANLVHLYSPRVRLLMNKEGLQITTY